MKVRDILLLVVLLVVFGLFFVRFYHSSPGFTSEDIAREFYGNVPRCKGLSFPINEAATYVDGAVISVCIGPLK